MCRFNNKEIILNVFDFNDLLKIVSIAKSAGSKVLEIYNTNFKFEFKSYKNPVTDADLISNKTIYEFLQREYPKIPIMSEELIQDFDFLSVEDFYWCIDPLDGTKEFISKNDEFTINIALIKNKKPFLGVIYAPAKKILYAALTKFGAFKELDGQILKKIELKKKERKKMAMIVSRSHLDEKTKLLIKKQNIKVIKLGSSLKLAYIAEGRADFYPRFSPTMLWDIAAGHCIINEAGGFLKTQHGTDIEYDPKKLVNNFFIALGDVKYLKEIK